MTIEGFLRRDVPWSTIEAATGIDEARLPQAQAAARRFRARGCTRELTVDGPDGTLRGRPVAQRLAALRRTGAEPWACLISVEEICPAVVI